MIEINSRPIKYFLENENQNKINTCRLGAKLLYRCNARTVQPFFSFLDSLKCPKVNFCLYFPVPKPAVPSYNGCRIRGCINRRKLIYVVNIDPIYWSVRLSFRYGRGSGKGVKRAGWGVSLF